MLQRRLRQRERRRQLCATSASSKRRAPLRPRLASCFPRTTMAMFALTSAAAIYLGIAIPKGFLPTEDVGTLFAFTEANQDVSFEAMYAQQQMAVARVREDPNVASTMSFTGGSSQQMNLGARRHPCRAPAAEPTR
jgi:multidrug efflux pump subunit AcrB